MELTLSLLCLSEYLQPDTPAFAVPGDVEIRTKEINNGTGVSHWPSQMIGPTLTLAPVMSKRFMKIKNNMMKLSDVM
jgi:hypothetical protein